MKIHEILIKQTEDTVKKIKNFIKEFKIVFLKNFQTL